MKNKILYCFCAAAVLAAAVSCQEKTNTGYDGKNYIELSAAVASTYDVPGLDPVSVEVNLTTSLDEDLTLNFVVKSDDNGVLELTDNPVVIAAGETSASFGIAVGNSLPAGVSSTEFEITLDEAVELPKNVQLYEDLKFSVKAASTSELTDGQKALVAAYKEKTGIDLSKYLGLVSVNVEFWEVPFDTEEYPEEPEKISTQSIIWLSSKSTADAPRAGYGRQPYGNYRQAVQNFPQHYRSEPLLDRRGCRPGLCCPDERHQLERRFEGDFRDVPDGNRSRRGREHQLYQGIG